ncbi:hypothetical protein Tco_0397715 [Tanacetum coccineum]
MHYSRWGEIILMGWESGDKGSLFKIALRDEMYFSGSHSASSIPDFYERKSHLRTLSSKWRFRKISMYFKAKGRPFADFLLFYPRWLCKVVLAPWMNNGSINLELFGAGQLHDRSGHHPQVTTTLLKPLLRAAGAGMEMSACRGIGEAPRIHDVDMLEEIFESIPSLTKRLIKSLFEIGTTIASLVSLGGSLELCHCLNYPATFFGSFNKIQRELVVVVGVDVDGELERCAHALK